MLYQQTSIGKPRVQSTTCPRITKHESAHKTDVFVRSGARNFPYRADVSIDIYASHNFASRTSQKHVHARENEITASTCEPEKNSRKSGLEYTPQ